MNASRKRAKTIFLDAVENCPPERWDAYLDEACDGDADLRRRVRVLLDAHPAQHVHRISGGTGLVRLELDEDTGAFAGGVAAACEGGLHQGP